MCGCGGGMCIAARGACMVAGGACMASQGGMHCKGGREAGFPGACVAKVGCA